jgi:N-acetylneuraminic acid mutarotase
MTRRFLVTTTLIVGFALLLCERNAGAKPAVERVITKTAMLPAGMTDHSCSGDSATRNIYCFGGLTDGNPIEVPWILEYDPTGDMLTLKTATLPTPRWGLSCAPDEAAGKIYCFGGRTENTALNEIVEYTPATNTVVLKAATLPTGRVMLSCAAHASSGKIYCTGGHEIGPSGISYLDEIVEYDPSQDRVVVKTARLPYKTGFHSCATDPTTDNIYCFGGFSPDYQQNWGQLNYIVEYNPTTDTVAVKTATLPAPTPQPSCVTNGAMETLYCLGGSNYLGSMDQIVEYNAATGTLIVKDVTLPSPRGGSSSLCATQPAASSVFCFGGYDTTQGRALDEVVEYIPISSSPSPFSGVPYQPPHHQPE